MNNIPNEETIKVIEKARESKLIEVISIDELFAELNEDEDDSI